MILLVRVLVFGRTFEHWQMHVAGGRGALLKLKEITPAGCPNPSLPDPLQFPLLSRFRFLDAPSPLGLSRAPVRPYPASPSPAVAGIKSLKFYATMLESLYALYSPLYLNPSILGLFLCFILTSLPRHVSTSLPYMPLISRLKELLHYFFFFLFCSNHL